MARPPLATTTDLGERLGESVDDDIQAMARLRDASAIVRAYAGKTWLDDAGDLDGVPDDIPGVVAAMVERATRNPTGTTQESAGPFTRSFGSEASSRLYLTKSEKLVVRAAAGRPQVGTLSTGRGDLETPAVVDEMVRAGEATEDSAPFAL